jgi:HTH-type transcriptional regulator / antitoxin HigA
METNNIFPYKATHPVELIKDELEARGMSKKELAERMGIMQSNLSRLMRGNTPLSIEMARRLESALDIPANFWIELQLQYDSDSAAIAQRNIEEQNAICIEKSLSLTFNLSELYKRLQLNHSHYIHDKLIALQELFGVEAANLPILAPVGAFKKSESLATDERNLATWLLLAYLSAKRNAPSMVYIEGNADLAARDIASEMNSGVLTQERISRILDGYGISYSVVPKLDKVPVDAYSTWEMDYPAIVTTNRRNDMSCLVFNVLHELGHISLHLTKGGKECFVHNEESTSKKEDEANNYAANMLIPRPIWNNIRCSAIPKGFAYIVEHLRNEASLNGLSQDVVIWRYKYETKCYNLKGAKPSPIV